MLKIYFDKQIFSYLYSKQDEKYNSLLEKIYANKEHFLFFYSGAHLQDLCKDKTDRKYEELEFIKSIVDNNYLSYDPIRKQPIVYKATPQTAFKEYIDVNNTNYYDNLNPSLITKEQKLVLINIKNIVDQALQGKLTNDFLKTRVPLTDDSNVDTISAIKSIQLIQKIFVEAPKFYRELRKNVITNCNNGKFTSTKGDLSFNESMQNSNIGMSFIDYLKNIIKQYGISDCGDAIVYLIAYGSLDLFGISKDKKVVHSNMITDGKHSYFASLCDCFVCLDKGCVEKTNSLYNLFKFNTKIYDIDEFIKEFDIAIQQSSRCLHCNINNIIQDCNNGEVLREESRDNTIVKDIKTSNIFFGYFEYIRNCIINGKETIILSKQQYTGREIIPFSEIKLIVNRLLRIIGKDSLDIGEFTDNEIKELYNYGEWKGLRWDFTDCTCLLKIMDYPYYLSFIIIKNTG